MADETKNQWEDSDDNYEVQAIEVDPKQTPLRIDKFLKERLFKVTRNRLQNAIRSGAVVVNEKEIKPNYKVRPGDRIEIVMPKYDEGEGHLLPQDIPLQIEYEDDHLLIVNKPSGMVVHPGVGNPRDTLVNALAFHFRDQDLPVMSGNSAEKIGLVHRIDKDTSGLLVVAKTEYAMSHLAKQFFHHTIERKYRAIVWGALDPEEGTIDGHIDRHPRNRLKRAVFADGSQGKHAITHYKTIEDLYYVSVVECQLETGRTHQIRVHMEYTGHPLFSDERYGGSEIRKGTIYSKYRQFVQNCFKVLPRQALHAYSLGFEHPETGEQMYFESALPDDMANCLDRWRNYVIDRKSKQNLG